jgi:hypothetical protein
MTRIQNTDLLLKRGTMSLKRFLKHLDSQQAYRIMKELENDGQVCLDGHGQSASWHLKQSSSKP